MDIAKLQGRAAAYKDGKLARDAAEPSGGTGGDLLATAQWAQELLPIQAGRLHDQPKDLVQINRTNPQIYHRGRIFKVTTYLIGEHQLVTTATAFTMFSTLDGEESLYFPLPVRVASSKRLMPFWQVLGARIRDPRPAWILKRIEYEKQHCQQESTG